MGRAHNDALMSTQRLEGGIVRRRLPRPCRSGARRFGSRRRMRRSAVRLHIVGMRGLAQLLFIALLLGSRFSGFEMPTMSE